MDTARFKDSPVGHLVPVQVTGDQRFEGTFSHYAFVPDPLPDEISLSPETQETVNDAALALGRLDAATSQLPNPLLLARPAIRKEAVSTAALEGTYAELQDVLESELLDDEGATRDLREVRNYIVAAEHALGLIERRPVSTNMINKLQAILVQNTRGDSWQAGAVRQTQVWIGPEDRPITESMFVPPPPGDVLIEGLSHWEKWIHGEVGRVPLLVKVAVGHYQFEALHPYNDGNGRLGRLIAILQLVEAGVLSYPVLYISPWLERRKEQYQEGLRAVSETGDYDSWVRFFSEALRDQSTDAVTRTQRLLALRDDMIDKLRARRAKGVALPIAEGLIGYPVITSTEASRQHNVSYQAANQAIMRLVDMGILVEMTGRRYARVFAAPEVLRIIR